MAPPPQPAGAAALVPRPPSLGALRSMLGTKPGVGRRPAAGADPHGSGTDLGREPGSIDLARVAWSVDFSLNGVSLDGVYADAMPQPVSTPHPAARAAGKALRKAAGQGAGGSERAVTLHWSAEQLSATPIAVRGGDRLTILAKASWMPARDEPTPDGASRQAAGSADEHERRTSRKGSALRALFTPQPPTPPAAGLGAPSGKGAEHAALFVAKLSIARRQSAVRPPPPAPLAGRRFFTSECIVHVPQRVERGAAAVRAAPEGASYTHASADAYAVTLRAMAAEAGDEEAGGYVLEALTVAIPLAEVSAAKAQLSTGSCGARCAGAGAAAAGGGGGGGGGAESAANAHHAIAFEMVRNLDTGELIHVSEVAERIPQGTGPEALHWLAQEEARASSLAGWLGLGGGADVQLCAAPLPLLTLHGASVCGATLKPVVTLDRRGVGRRSARADALRISAVTWRRLCHHGRAERPAELGAQRGADGRAHARVLSATDVDATVSATASLAAPTDAGGRPAGGAAVLVRATAYSAVVPMSPAQRDAVSAALAAHSAAFDAQLLGESAAAEEGRGDGGDGGGGGCAGAQEGGAQEGGLSPGARPKRALPRALTRALTSSEGGGAGGGGAGGGLAARLAARRASAADPEHALAARAHGAAGGCAPEPASERACTLTVSMDGVTVLHSKLRRRHAPFGRGRAAGARTVFSADEGDAQHRRFTLLLAAGNGAGRLFTLRAPSAWHRDLIELTIAKMGQRAASAGALPLPDVSRLGAASGRSALEAGGGLAPPPPSPLLFAEPALGLAGGEALGARAPAVGEPLEAAVPRTAHAHGCALQWWRVHAGGARVPIGGACERHYRPSAEDVHCRLALACAPYAHVGAERVFGCALVATTHAPVAPGEDGEAAVRSAHSWGWAELRVRAAPVEAGVGAAEEQLRRLPPEIATALAEAGVGAAAGAADDADARRLSLGARPAAPSSPGGSTLAQYIAVVTKRELKLRLPGVVGLGGALVQWALTDGASARIPLWDQPLLELDEDELSPCARRLYVLCESLEERDEFVLAFNFLAASGLQAV